MEDKIAFLELLKAYRGTQVPSYEQVKEIKELYEKGYTQRELAIAYKTSIPMISRILNNKSYKFVP